MDFSDGIFDVGDWEKRGDGWRARLEEARDGLRKGFDTRHYDREDLQWYRRSYLEYFTFMWDAAFYDPVRKRYRMEELIDRGIAEFGGFDFLLLWYGYPRLGVDERSQFDILRDMPGGLAGLREAVDAAHARGVRVFLPYMPWDRGTRREDAAEEEILARIVADLDVDGLVLDTMNAASPELRQAVDAARPGVVFSPEYYPPSKELAEICTGSDLASGRRLNHVPDLWFGANFMKLDELPRKVLIIKWIEPRYSVRGNMGHYPVYQFQCPTAANDFFHGMGHQVLENTFGWWSPYTPEAKRLLRRCMRLLRVHHDAFMDPGWQPYVETRRPGLFAHRWTDGEKVLYTFFNNRGTPLDGPVIDLPAEEGRRFYDAWDGGEAEVEVRGGRAAVSLTVDALSCGCLIVQPDEWEPPVSADLDAPTDAAYADAVRDGPGRPADHLPKPVIPSVCCSREEAPEEMKVVPPAEFRMKIYCDLTAPEGGCYSYPDRKGHPERLVRLAGFLIDETEVTNADYHRFLQEARYSPDDLSRFLDNWLKPGGPDSDPGTWEIPPGRERHPVTWVDLEDSRAYARWAGKRLPTEEEWQYAGQGADGRKWPWGGTYDETRCNGLDGTQGWNTTIRGSFGDTSAVDAYPAGAGPFGCLDMCGNVWEWTESERDDGHTRYAILKGGSYFRAGDTRWYTPGGAQPCNRHCKMLLLHPGLDRCSTVGFRCVKDLKGETS